MSTYTSSLGLELITPGSQAGLWGNTTNNSLNLIDQAITGVTPISFASASGSTHTLTDYNGAEDEARAAVLNITGTASGANTVVIPNKQKTYLVRNETGQDITFQTPTATTPYVVATGYNTLIFCDGNNGVFAGIRVPGASTLGVNGGGTGTTTFTAGFVKSPGGTTNLTTSSTVSLASEVSGTLPVSNGGTGQTSLTSGALLFGNGSSAVGTFVGSTNKDAVVWNGSAWTSTGVVNSITAGTGVTITGGSGGKGDLTISASGSSSGVTSIVAGTGISVNQATGAVTVTNTGPSLSSNNTWTGTSTWNNTCNHVANVNFQGNGSYNFYHALTGYLYNSIYYGATSTALADQGYVMAFKNPAGNSFVGPYQFWGNGTANATNWNSTSDARIKENVIKLQDGLDTVSKLNPVKFSYKRDNLTKPDHYGLIAQELELILPDMVSNSGITEGDVTNVKSVSYSQLIPILIKAVQELKAEVDALKAAK